jgi:hypothetical protein
MAKKFRAWLHVSMEVETTNDQTVQWADEIILQDLHDSLVEEGLTIDDMDIEEIE